MKTFLLIVWIVSPGPTIKYNIIFNSLEACKKVVQSIRRQALPIRPPKIIYIEGGGSKLSYINCTEVLS